jgi:RNA polymerase sigma-70 factor (ECF subfamily)
MTDRERDDARIGACEVPALVDRLFRDESARLVAGLARVFGPAHLGLVEDVVQEALFKALRVWPYEGVPRRPDAWLVRVARNLAIDALRKNDLEERVADDVKRWAEDSLSESEVGESAVVDDQLSLMFTCCHPALAFDSRVALTLKSLCGFGTREIARAFLADETAVAQRLVRTKRRIQEERIPLEVPDENGLDARLDAVLEVVYLLFNEGYAAHAGEELVRADLVHEALRLGELLVASPATRRPRVHALLALMSFQGARIPARVDAAGDILTLAQQDRTLWNQAWLARGWRNMDLSIAGDELSAYHIECAIAACHAAAPSYADTDWSSILERYDQLVTLSPSPIVKLNRAVAVAKVFGLDAGLAALDELENSDATRGIDASLAAYHLLPATRAQFLWSKGDMTGAAAQFERALRLVITAPERRLLERRLGAARTGSPPEPF